MKEILSPCHEQPLTASLGDGVLIGSCPSCYSNIVRRNNRTGLVEWLDGQSPWTSAELRVLPDNQQEPHALAFLPALAVVSSCHDAPVIYCEFTGGVRVGRCGYDGCNTIFARVNPETGRIEKVEGNWWGLGVNLSDSDSQLLEFPEEFQPSQLEAV